MEFVPGDLVYAAGILAFFAGIALLVWICSRESKRQRELQHTERMKALELGQSLPDGEIAHAKAALHRAWAAGLVGLFVPVATMAASIGASFLVFANATPSIHLPLLSVIWGVSGLVSLVAVTTSLGVLSSRSKKHSCRQKT